MTKNNGILTVPNEGTFTAAIKPWNPVTLVSVRKLHEEATIPERGSELASGFDLHALDVIAPDLVGKIDYIKYYDGVDVQPGERVLVRTGVAVQMRRNMEAQIRPRSGLALKKGIYVALGTIDADYTGDLGVVLTNMGDEPLMIRRGDRIAQLVFAPVLHDVALIETSSFAETERGDGGFGHTGVSNESDELKHKLREVRDDIEVCIAMDLSSTLSDLQREERAIEDRLDELGDSE